ncbi:F-box domain [Dillenia turbinata]|uniref:F-box domain n=1 Tax=Dillenia turbinata TaxID=194707 RepID=A0AAN8YVQ7_9MAGN
MELGAVGDLAINLILSKLEPKEVAVFACVSKKCRVWASDELLWSKFCFHDLDLSSPLDHLGNPTPSFKDTYKIWREAFRMYPWPLVRRVKRCWGRLRSWLAANLPEAEATLRKGVSEEEIKGLERSLKVKLPLPTRVLYRFCDGQDLMDGNLAAVSWGLIGGYSFYKHFVNVYLLPLRSVIMETKEIVHKLGFSATSKYILIASSSTYIEKLFFLDCTTGQLHVGTRNLTTDGEMIPCVPAGMISSVHDVKATHQQDAMLLWLEEHCRRLESGMIKVREQGKFRGISQFPEEAPLCSTAVTNNVQVRASSVFVPELSNLQDESEKYTFSYSIRMRLLPEGCIINGLYYDSCQLHWWHWIIRANDEVISDFNAEAVIGKFPLLLPGPKDFVYESSISLPTSQGSLEGSFTFVPGSLTDPKGSPFEAQVARFYLQVPEYFF